MNVILSVRSLLFPFVSPPPRPARLRGSGRRPRSRVARLARGSPGRTGCSISCPRRRREPGVSPGLLSFRSKEHARPQPARACRIDVCSARLQAPCPGEDSLVFVGIPSGNVTSPAARCAKLDCDDAILLRLLRCVPHARLGTVWWTSCWRGLVRPPSLLPFRLLVRLGRPLNVAAHHVIAVVSRRLFHRILAPLSSWNAQLRAFSAPWCRWVFSFFFALLMPFPFPLCSLAAVRRAQAAQRGIQAQGERQGVLPEV